MINYLKNYYSQKPLQFILFTAFLLRVLAAFFAKGYGMHDDHFLIIETSGSFADGDYNFTNWLPSSIYCTGPQGHSFFYMGLHYLLFLFLNTIGIISPDIKMHIVRIIHAVYSLSVVYFGYKIVFKYAGQKTASQTAWLLAALWFMPWLSVRNIVEIQCIPFLLWGVWIYLKKENLDIKAVIFSGLISGIAFSIRFQSIFFLFGFGLALLFMKRFRDAVIWGISAVFTMLFIQSSIDFFIWGKPLVELQEYVRYNFEAAGEYLKGSFFKYIWVILGMLLPPISIFLFWGFFARWRKYLLLFLPSFIFLFFHCIFLNKQERFIFTIIPSIIILGMIGWHEFILKYSRQRWLQNFIKGSLVFALAVNTALLCIATFHYSKKARVESMRYLSQYKNINCIAVTDDVPVLPKFYLGQWVFQQWIQRDNFHGEYTRLQKLNINPQFFIITKNSSFQSDLDSLKTYYPKITFETEIKPNYVDDLLHRINPHNKNEILIIYRNQEAF